MIHLSVEVICTDHEAKNTHHVRSFKTALQANNVHEADASLEQWKNCTDHEAYMVHLSAEVICTDHAANINATLISVN